MVNADSGSDRTDQRPAANSSAWRAELMGADLARNWWLVVLRGVLGILFGVIAFAMPILTLFSLTLVYAAYMLVDGTFAIAAAVRAARRRQRWGLLTAEGVVTILAGIVAFIWPGLTIIVFVLLIAAWAVVSGALTIAAAVRMRRRKGRWLIGLGGLASVIFGMLLVAWPPVGAVVLLWWLGAYAIAFGAILIGAGIRLRSLTPPHTTAAAAT
jgi:uncharacterized membrane protein HdeD (DUF308 family)